MKPISAALSAFEARGIDLALLSHVYSLPAGLLESPPLEKFAAACKKKLVELFGDVPAVITGVEQRQRFCTLPYAAVLAWLHSDNLKVHSESCVLFLLTAWVNSKEHPACNPYQLKQLAHSVRVGQLSPTYLHCVLPDLKWFQNNCSGEGRLVRALQLKSGHVGASCSSWAGPAAWVADKRKGTAMPASIGLEWNLGAGDIAALDVLPLSCCKIYSPGKAYLSGIFYELLVQKVAKAIGDPAVTLGVYLRVDFGSMRPVLEFWDPEGQPCLFRAELCASRRVWQQLHSVCTGPSVGAANFLGRSGATIAEVVAPYLDEGRLNLKAVIRA